MWSIDRGICIAVDCQNGTVVIQTQADPASDHCKQFANSAEIADAYKWY